MFWKKQCFLQLFLHNFLNACCLEKASPGFVAKSLLLILKKIIQQFKKLFNLELPKEE